MMTEYERVLEELENNPKKWLVTGVAGFIGSNLLEKLLKQNQYVVGIDNFLTGHEKNLEEVRLLVTNKQWNNFKLIRGDIKKYGDCVDACKGVDYVLHQAALGSVPRSIADPITSNNNNVNGFLNIITAAKEERVENFIYASSSSVYGDHIELPKIENRIGNQLSPYAVSKKVNELYSSAFNQVYNFSSIGLRYFNVFGARQSSLSEYAAVIPKWVSAMLNNEEIFIYGDGKTSRDFCYIDNVVQVNILAACSKNKDALGEVFNVAYGDRTSLNNLFKEIETNLIKLTNKQKFPKPNYVDFRAGDVRHSLADISKAKNLLGYNPKFSLKSGLKEATKWYVDNMSKI